MTERAQASGGEALSLSQAKTQEHTDALLRKAAEQRARGDLEDAFASLEAALRLAAQGPYPVRHALALGGLSDAHLLARQVDEAVRYAQEAVALARETDAPAALAATLNHLGNALTADRSYRDALAAYLEGVALARQIAEPALLTTLLTNTVHAYLASDHPGEAVSALRSALIEVQAVSTSSDKALSLIALGHLAVRLAEVTSVNRRWLVDAAYATLTEASQLANQAGDLHLRSYAYGHLGELYATVEQFQDAEHSLRRALLYASDIEAPELLGRWYWQLARVLKAEGKLTDARAAYGQALAQLARIQPAIIFGQRGYPESFRNDLGAAYLELAEVWLQEASTAATEQERHAALREARAVVEKFRSVELKTYFLDDCVTELQQRVPILELDDLLAPGTAALYTIVFPERTAVLLTLPSGIIRHVDVPVKADTLRETVVAFRRQLSRVGNPRKLRKHGLTLYEWLLEPIAHELEQNAIDTLVIVSDDVLRTVPFAALYDGHDFLVRRYAFVLTPGLTLTDPEPFQKDGQRFLLSGLSERRQGFSALRHVPAEVRTVASLYKSTELLDEAFRKEQVEGELERTAYSGILFATHARLQGDPRQSFLLTYDGKITLDELEQFIRISQFREQPVELLILSACDTAEGDERAALGLAGVAVKAGARSALASLWSVNDASTAELVPAFLRHIKDRRSSKAKALQEAQKELLADRMYRHPFYWSAFVLIGNWH